ncbi:flagellar hook-associated protein FlgK [Jatrophihabitans sp. DSM 45814]
MTSFAGLIGASQALAAQSYALDVTGQNIDNADTPGYTRQRADMATVGPVAGVPTMYATQRASTGVTVAGTSRIDDPVLDARVRTEHDRNSYAQTSSAQLSDVQTLFDEPTDNGLAEQLNDMWNAWSAVANHPDDASARSVVLQSAATVATSLNTTSKALSDLATSATATLDQTVVDINTAAGSLATINAAIAIANATGTNTNSLADQRDSLLLKLADAAGTQATVQPDGSATVTLGGQTLVSGLTASTVAVTASNTLTVNGAAAGTAGGTAQGLVDALNTTLPAYAAKLDAVAAALSSTVNAAHQAGYDLSGATGTPFFSGNTAATIAVAVTDPAKIAASGTPGGNFDGSTAKALAAFGSKTGGADDTYKSMVSTLASDVQRASQTAAVQSAVVTNADAQQQSVSGVSFDEETANMLTYQRAYQASARVLTTVDDMLDTLINRTGRVGL